MNSKDLHRVELLAAERTALLLFQKTVKAHHPALIAALQVAGYAVDPVAAPRLTVRLARASADAGVRDALRAFEVVVRPAALEYVRAARRLGCSTIDPQAHAVIEHFDRFTEVPITATRVQRVLIWARRTYRAIREAVGHDEH